jgi:hypothetical protein
VLATVLIIARGVFPAMAAVRAAPEPHHEEEQGGEDQKRKKVTHGGTHFRMSLNRRSYSS